MKITSEVQNILDQNTYLKGQILSAISRVEQWLDGIPPVFFPEYTRHDNKHNEEVFLTAIELATDDALKLLSADDITVLIGATLLHDSAMHLSEDGFISLISPVSKWHPIKPFDQKTWAILWEDFLGEATRFDEYKLLNVLGDTKPVTSFPSDNWLDWTERVQRLIGDFIRIHHTRLSHEMAIYGVPGATDTPYMILNDEFPRHLADLAGLVARSHGIELRGSLDYLKEKYDLRDFNRVHAVYLMALLRIADFLQIQSERAPRATFELRKLKSPLSQQEWRVHASVQNITNTSMDPEAIEINARPSNAQDFVRVQSWLKGIQYELDASWAVLGEVYGRFQNQDLDQLKIRIRRIRSNIDNIENFQKSVNYIPRIVRFESAGTDLLKLLIEPLYGNDKSIGVRELLQNAIDAVREYDHVQSALLRDEKSGNRRLDFRIHVNVKFNAEGEPSILEIVDSGIGMNSEILLKYFLTAGASFRRSDAWRAEFENERGESEVERSGRFGVGALAAFLLGEELSVKTRRYDEPPEHGLSFTARLEDRIINVSRENLPVGTQIQIKLNEQSKKILSLPSAILELQWYWLPTPKIEYRIGPEVVHSRSGALPDIGEQRPVGWGEIKSNELTQINWSYRKGGDYRNRAREIPAFFCNGFPLKGQEVKSSGGGRMFNIGDVSVPDLTVSVIDRDGNLPIDLARTRIAGHPSLFYDIEVAVARDYTVSCLLSENNIVDGSKGEIKNIAWEDGVYDRYIERRYWYRTINKYVFSVDGILPTDKALLINQKVSHIISIPKDQKLLEALLRKFRQHEINHVGITWLDSHLSDAPTSVIARIRSAYLESSRGDWTMDRSLRQRRISSIVHGRALQIVKVLKNLPQWVLDEIAENSDKGWYHVGVNTDEILDFDKFLIGELRKASWLDDSALFVHTDKFEDIEKEYVSPLSKCWEEMVGGKLPYDRRERLEIGNRFPADIETHRRLREAAHQ